MEIEVDGPRREHFSTVEHRRADVAEMVPERLGDEAENPRPPTAGEWAEALGAMQEEVFEWRQCDCLTGVGQVLWLALGRDPLAEVRTWAYGDAQSAVALCEEKGGLARILDRFLVRRVPGEPARTGDVALVEGRYAEGLAFGGMGVGLVVGAEVWGKTEGVGMAVVAPATSARMVWKVRGAR